MKLFATLLVLSVIVSGCFLQPKNAQQDLINQNRNETSDDVDHMMEDEDSMMEEDDAMMEEEDSMMEEDDAMMEDEDSMMEDTVSYSGRVLAGTTSPVIDFNKADFDAAVAANKDIVLYFYAKWCPICRAEVPKMYSAFNQLDNPNVVAFRVNFNDSDTDDDEEALAREHGVAYQHTKVFIENGQRILKSPESWEMDRYLTEINSAFSN